MRCVCILIALTVIQIYGVRALEDASSKQIPDIVPTDNDDYYDDDDYDYSVEDKKGGKHKHKNKLFLFAAGLKSLIAFIAIKIKIILTVVTVIGIIGFILKVFGALKYAGYIGGTECPVIHEHEHEPVYTSGYSATPPPHDHVQEYGTYGTNNDWSSTATWGRSLIENYVDTDIFSHALKNMDIAEMVFSTLEMDDDQCRRRLVCEIDAQTRQLPLLSYAMNFFSRGFERYRTSEKTKFSECAKMYSECDDDHKKSRRRRKRSVGKNKHKNHTTIGPTNFR